MMPAAILPPRASAVFGAVTAATANASAAVSVIKFFFMITPPSTLCLRASNGAHFFRLHGQRSAELRHRDDCAEQQDHEDDFHDVSSPGPHKETPDRCSSSEITGLCRGRYDEISPLVRLKSASLRSRDETRHETEAQNVGDQHGPSFRISILRDRAARAGRIQRSLLCATAIVRHSHRDRERRLHPWRLWW